VQQGNNSYGIIFDTAIATEQEFNSRTYGLRGKVDATIKMVHPTSGESRTTALELKTGREQPSHRGQVLLYSLLLAERFKSNTNPQNLLLYLGASQKPKTYYISLVR
jgi:hypothetical protein